MQNNGHLHDSPALAAVLLGDANPHEPGISEPLVGLQRGLALDVPLPGEPVGHLFGREASHRFPQQLLFGGELHGCLFVPKSLSDRR